MSPTSGTAMAALHRKLALLATAIMAVVLAGTAITLITWQRHDLIEGVDAALRREADTAQAMLVSDTFVADNSGEDRGVQIVGPDGSVIAASTILAGQPPLAPIPTSRDKIATLRLPIDDDSFRLLSRRVDLPSGVDTVHVIETLSDVHDSVRTLTESLLITFPPVLALLAVLTWWLIGRTLRPVAAAAQRQERFVADASHELRTPLARARTRLDVDIAHPEGVDLSETATAVAGELAEMDRLITDLLFLARHDATASPQTDEVRDLDDVVFAEASALRADTPRLSIDTSAVTAARVRGRIGELTRVVRNVLDNARRHAASRVGIALAESAHGVTLTVDDDGPGIPPDQREEVFGRFVRLDPVRTPGPGHPGLGLAIAHDIVVSHGGSIAIADSPWGGGRVVITLPGVASP
ncbi:MAG TPA: HAMP domain-containing sensor histidine kinase [Ilumatobacteraceae bacterium]